MSGRTTSCAETSRFNRAMGEGVLYTTIGLVRGHCVLQGVRLVYRFCNQAIQELAGSRGGNDATYQEPDAVTLHGSAA